MGSIFFEIGIVLFVSKLFSIFSRRIKLPQVVGALVAGVIIGSCCLGLVTANETFMNFAEVGVVMLMFTAGLGTDLSELKKTGVAALIIAIIGVVVPLAGGYIVYLVFFPATDPSGYYTALFMGVVLTATSVSITVETLREMGKLQGKVGSAILGAAVIDDIIGILLLTFVIGMNDGDVNLSVVALKTVGFLVATGVIGIVMNRLFKYLTKKFGNKKRLSVLSLSLCFLLAYMSEAVFGITDITGAYFAGVMLCNLHCTEYINDKITAVSELMFSPIFFASIGIQTVITGMDSNLIFFSITLLVVAILTKIVGCGFGAKLCRFSTHESVCVGVGMISRGEVALIVAQRGLETGVLSATMFPAVVVVVIVTTLITPLLLKLAFRRDLAPITDAKEHIASKMAPDPAPYTKNGTYRRVRGCR